MASLVIQIAIPLEGDVFERAKILVALEPTILALRTASDMADAVFEMREEPSGAAHIQAPPPAPRKRPGRPTNAEKAAAAAALADLVQADLGPQD